MKTKSKPISLILILALLLSVFPAGGITIAGAAGTLYPKVDFTDSSLAAATGLTYSASYKYGSSSGSSKYYVNATTKETKTFEFSSYGTSSDWSYGDTIVIPMYNAYAGQEAVNLVITRSGATKNTSAGYFQYRINLDWNGWKLLKIPKSKFSKANSASWADVNSLFFNTGGWNAAKPTGIVEFYVDSVYAASNASTDECYVDGSDPLVAKAMGLTSEKAVSTDAYPSAKFTASGKETATKGFEFANHCISNDWSDVKIIDFRIYNVNANGQKVNVAINKTANTNVSGGYYYTSFNLDWTGWKTISVSTATLTANYNITSMNDIHTIFFNVGGWPSGSSVAEDVEFYIGYIEGITNAALVSDAIPDSSAVYVNSTKALKELSAVTLTNPPIYINNTVYASLSLFAALFDASAEDNTLTMNSITLEFTEGASIAKTGLYEHKLSAPAILENEEIYVPLSDICELFDIPLNTDGRLAVMGSDSDIDFIRYYDEFGINEINEQIAEKLVPQSDGTLTDADCEAVIANWLESIVGNETINDTTDTYIKSKITSVTNTAVTNRSLLIKTDGSSELFSDQTTSESADMTTTIRKIYQMALAYGTYGGDLYQDEELLADILYSLEWFYENRYGLDEINGTGWRSTSSFNWHDWKIGTPGYLIPTMMIVRESLTAEQISNYLKLFHHVSPTVYSSGANYMDACELIVGAAALENNPDRIMEFKGKAEEAFVYVDNGRQLESQLDSARQAYTPNKGHGFYKDGSYIYHTLHPMNGSYGLSHLTSASELVMLFDGTAFEIAKPYVDNMADWIINNFDSTIYGTRMMRMVLGRSENPNETSASRTIVGIIVNCFDCFDEQDKIRLGSIVKRYAASAPSVFASSVDTQKLDLFYEILESDLYDEYRHDFANVFGNIDKVLQRREDWGIGISMSSSRIFNYESINDLNKNGWYLGDGRTELILKEEADTSATAYWTNVNYYRLPGTTVDTQERKEASICQGNEYLSTKDFVGGVSLGGKYSAAAMHLESYHNETDFGKDGGSYGGPAPAHTNDLTAKKSYFMFDNEIYCLGAEVNASNNNNAEVLTVVENRPGSFLGTSRLFVSADGVHRESENFDIKRFGAGSDWSGVKTIRVPIYSKAANGEKVNVLFCKDAIDPNLGYFSAKITVDWTGWKVVDISTSSFSKGRGIQNWNDINSMYFNIGGWGNPTTQATTDLYFADVQGLDSSGGVVHTIPLTNSLTANAGLFDFSHEILYGIDSTIGVVSSNLGDIEIPFGTDKALADVTWINPNGDIGYIFPDSSMNGTLKAAMSDNGYLEAVISHGTNPANGSYAYAILPNMDEAQTADYAENPDVEILANTGDVQAVRYKKENITSIVFWNAGTFEDITVSEPMMVMIKDDGNDCTISASDPTHKLTGATITIAKPLLLSYANERITQTATGKTVTLAVNFEEALGASLEAQLKSSSPVIYSLEFKDSGGNVISQYLSQNEARVTASVYIRNLGTEVYSGKAFAALYDAEGSLENVQTSLMSNVASGGMRRADIVITPTESTKKIEIFVWDSASLKPCGTLYRN